MLAPVTPVTLKEVWPTLVLIGALVSVHLPVVSVTQLALPRV